MTISKATGELAWLAAGILAIASSAHTASAAQIENNAAAGGKPDISRSTPNAPTNQRSAPSGAGGQPGLSDREATDVPPAGGSAPLVGADLEILKTLHEDVRVETAMGRAAAEQGSSPAIKVFARKVVVDHAAADRKIDAYLKAKKLDRSIFTAVKVDQPADHDLGQHTGQDFDRAFCQRMIDGHVGAIERVKMTRNRTTDPQLKALLTGLLPTLENHLKTARSLARKIQATGA